MKEMIWYLMMFFGMLAVGGQDNGRDDIGQELSEYVIMCAEMQDKLRQDIPSIIGKDAADEETAQEIEKELRTLPEERVSICIGNGDFDTGGIAEELARCWDKYRRRNHYAVSVRYMVEDEKRETAMLPFLCLLEDECRAALEENGMDAEKFPSYIRLERLNGLDIYTFHPNIQGMREDNEYLVILNGTWEGKEVSWQALSFPSTGCMPSYKLVDSYCTTQADINYDASGDLLIREGYSSGSGGSWVNYRGLIWKEETGEFVWYKSLPGRISSFEFEKERVIDRYQLGVGAEYVCEYKVVNGEYVEARRLAWEGATFSYYEMGVLVSQYDTTDMEYKDIIALYPDLDYWWRG